MPINWVLGSIYSVLLCLFIAFTRYKGGWVSMLRQRVIPRHATTEVHLRQPSPLPL